MPAIGQIYSQMPYDPFEDALKAEIIDVRLDKDGNPWVKYAFVHDKGPRVHFTLSFSLFLLRYSLEATP